MRPLIGYNYGAGEQKRVKKIYEITLAMSAVIMALGTILCLVASRGLMELFTENAETIAAGGTALRIISAGFIISSVSVTASGALEGLGKGTQSLVISLFRYVILMIPAAFVLCRIFGPTGVWHAFWITKPSPRSSPLMSTIRRRKQKITSVKKEAGALSRHFFLK